MARVTVASSSQDNSEFSLLGKLASLVVLLGAALYFTGWVYRWAYFSFFQVEVTTLNLPVESFYIAAFQVFFGNPLAIFRTAIAFIITAIAILVTLHIVDDFLVKKLKKILQKFSYHQSKSIQFLGSLVDEIVIVLWILTVLFWLATWQGDADAWTDALNDTSTLPIVTVVASENNAALGRKLDDPFVNPTNVRIIGDLEQYKKLLGKDFTDTSNPDESRVWRLLIDRDGYFYIFPALPSNRDRALRPLVLTIHESGNGDQLMILSPNSSKKP